MNAFCVLVFGLGRQTVNVDFYLWGKSNVWVEWRNRWEAKFSTATDFFLHDAINTTIRVRINCKTQLLYDQQWNLTLCSLKPSDWLTHCRFLLLLIITILGKWYSSNIEPFKIRSLRSWGVFSLTIWPTNWWMGNVPSSTGIHAVYTN